MSTHKHIDLICVVVLILTLLATVLFMNGERYGIQVIVDADAAGSAGSAWFTANELRGDWNTSAATVITLKGDTASVSGGGAYVYDGNVIISNAGRYILRGTLDDGSVIVDAKSTAKIWLLLDGVTISCADDACLRVDQADKVFLTLAEGSENSMSSGAVYSDEALADGRDAVIFSRDDLTINGSGSLTVTASYRHGISGNDDLVITGGKLTVSAPQDAIRGNDALYLCNASITAEAGDDALVLNGPEGTLYIESGTLHLSAAGDALHSADSILIAGGSLDIQAGDDGIHADASFTLTGGTVLIEECYEGVEAITIDMQGGELSVYPTDDGLNANGGSGGFGFGPNSAQTESEAEESWIHISGGTLTVVNESARDADGLDSNGDIVISGGVIRVSLPSGGTNCALDYGSESGGVCTVTGGEIVACGSYSMAEGFDESSTQCAILYNFSEGAAAGTTVSLETLDGETLVSYTAPCSFDSVALSAPGMRVGESYRVVIGDKSAEITLEETTAAYGNAASSMFGGTMNWGGQRPGGGPGKRPGSSDGESSDTPPARPDFADGEAPADFGGMGEPPERPANGDGEAPADFEGMAPPSDMPDFGGGAPGAENAQTTAETAQTEQTQFVPDAVTWTLLAFSFLALAAGLVLAIRFEP